MARQTMRRWLDREIPADPGADPRVRHPGPGDEETLAELMLDAWRGSIDFDPDDTLEGARAEVARTFAGDYGTFSTEASYVAFEGGVALSAPLITRYEGAPFVAFTMTRGSHKGQGLARALLTRSLWAVSHAGDPWIDLEVTVGNEPAERLYRSLGFEVIEVLSD